jgi:hypothetical protein
VPIDTSDFRCDGVPVPLHDLRRTHLGPFPSEGARQAWLKLAELDWDLARFRREIAAKTGRSIPSGHLTKYLYCDRRPGILWADVFSKVLGVEPTLWHDDPVEPFLPPAAQRSPEPTGTTG